MKIKCRFGKHDLIYLNPSAGYVAGTFGPCMCKNCDYKFDGNLQLRETQNVILKRIMGYRVYDRYGNFIKMIYHEFPSAQ